MSPAVGEILVIQIPINSTVLYYGTVLMNYLSPLHKIEL